MSASVCTRQTPSRGPLARAFAPLGRARAASSALAAAGVALALGGAWASPARAQGAPPPAESEEEREARKIREAQERLRAVEEVFLRTQLEQQLNQVARWDAEAGGIVLKEGDLGGLSIPIELFLEEVAEPAGQGPRLRIKKDVKVRPFAVSIQAYMAAGGMKDIEAMQRGQQPFADGVPDRVWRLIGDLLAALNAQDEERLARESESEERRRELQDQLADRLGLDRHTVDLYGRIVRETVRGLERRLEGGSPERVVEGARSFAESPRGQRLAKQIVESEAVLNGIEQVERSVEAFLGTEPGQELQDRVARYLETPDGARLQEQLDAMLRTPEGQRLLERWDELAELRRKRARERDGGAERPAPQPRSGERRQRAEPRERQGGRRPDRQAEPTPY